MARVAPSRAEHAHWGRQFRGAPQTRYRVAATCAAAKAFHAKTGAAGVRWDAGDFEACAGGIREVEAAVEPTRCPGQQCRIVPNSSLHKMTKAQCDAVITTDLDALS